MGKTSKSQRKQNELAHMKPSNMFDDITEDEFNKREQNKNAYKQELFKQMQEASQKKDAEKRRRQMLEMEDEMKIMNQLDQLKDQYQRETGNSPQRSVGVASKIRSDSNNQGYTYN